MKHRISNLLKFSALFFCLTVLFQSCTYNEVTIVTVENVQIRSISKKSIELNVDVKINNPNTYNIKIKNSNINVWVNKVNLGKAKLDKNISLKKESTANYTIPVSADLNKLDKDASIMGIASMLISQSAHIKIEGNLRASVYAGIVSKKIPIDFEQTVRMKK